MRPFFVSTAALFLASCMPTDQPLDHSGAQANLISDGFFRMKPISKLGTNEPLVTFGIPYLQQTNFVKAAETCDGAAGSVLPPLAFNECTLGVINLPSLLLDQGLQSIAPGNYDSQYDRHVALQGLERFWVHQEDDNLCWAAALQTIRGYLHEAPISQRQMPQLVANMCPRLVQRERAELFEMIIVMSQAARLNHDVTRGFEPCNEARCIIDSLLRHRPVLVLKSSHVILIQGADYMEYQGHKFAKRYKILDPAGNRTIETRDPLELCTADAVIALR